MEPDLVGFLGKHGVAITAESQERSFVETLAITLLPWLLIIGFFVYTSRKFRERPIADRAYDCDPLRKRWKTIGIDLIVPHRKNRKKPKTQDGRKLRRYRTRWKVERTIAWLGNFRRLIVRHERHIQMYRGFFNLACIMIVLDSF